MPVSCTPNDLAAASDCFCGISELDLLRIQVYLLATINGSSTDPNVLLSQASCLCGIDDPIQLMQISNFLLCSIVNA